MRASARRLEERGYMSVHCCRPPPADARDGDVIAAVALDEEFAGIRTYEAFDDQRVVDVWNAAQLLDVRHAGPDGRPDAAPAEARTRRRMQEVRYRVEQRARLIDHAGIAPSDPAVTNGNGPHLA